jgi:hypothetical protein
MPLKRISRNAPCPCGSGRKYKQFCFGKGSVELTSDDLEEIDAAASEIKVQGARYPEKLEQMTGR